MEQKSGAQISHKAFVQSVLILLALMTFADLVGVTRQTAVLVIGVSIHYGPF